MRKKLKQYYNQRTSFTGTFVRYGMKRGFNGLPLKTMLLSDIRLLNQDKVLADHLWFTVGKRLGSLELKEGDVISFDARVTSYQKGYKGFREDVFDKPISTDFRLSYPTRVKILNETHSC